ncbi:hypothetical protein PR048_003452 [Dryococelus australis]|uniref:Uncharacterized protein n=1 Tax=Dryococelus australis TaxID=614101 RepID=A0ABQ9IN43_9NEOP|nr:hypothetical protein PR048_003452 [Dryococelus australis]
MRAHNEAARDGLSQDTIRNLYNTMPRLLVEFVRRYGDPASCCEKSEEIWAALNSDVLRSDEVWSDTGMKGRGEMGDPRENPPTNGIVRHDSRGRKSGVTRPGIEPGSPWWLYGPVVRRTIISYSASRPPSHCDTPPPCITAYSGVQQTPDVVLRQTAPRLLDGYYGTVTAGVLTGSPHSRLGTCQESMAVFGRGRGAPSSVTLLEYRTCSPGQKWEILHGSAVSRPHTTRPSEFQYNMRRVDRLSWNMTHQTIMPFVGNTLASHQDEPGSFPGRVTRFPQVVIVPGDAVDRRGFAGISTPPPPNSGAAPYSLQSPLPALKTPLLRSAQISSITHSPLPDATITSRRNEAALATENHTSPVCIVPRCFGLAPQKTESLLLHNSPPQGVRKCTQEPKHLTKIVYQVVMRSLRSWRTIPKSSRHGSRPRSSGAGPPCVGAFRQYGPDDPRGGLHGDVITLRAINFVLGPRGRAVSPLASHQGDPGSILGRITPYFRMWESCRTVSGFSRGSPVSPPSHSSAVPFSLQSPSSALKTTMLRAVKISPPTPFVGINTPYLEFETALLYEVVMLSLLPRYLFGVLLDDDLKVLLPLVSACRISVVRARQCHVDARSPFKDGGSYVIVKASVSISAMLPSRTLQLIFL